MNRIPETCHRLSRPVNTSQYLSRSPAVSQNCAIPVTACQYPPISVTVRHGLPRPVRIAQNPSRPAMVSRYSPTPITLGGCSLGPAGRRCRGCMRISIQRTQLSMPDPAIITIPTQTPLNRHATTNRPTAQPATQAPAIAGQSAPAVSDHH